MDWKQRIWKLGLVGIFAVSSAVPALSYASIGGLTPSGRTPGETITDMLTKLGDSGLADAAPDSLPSEPDVADMGDMGDMGGEPMLMAAGWSGSGSGGYGGGGSSTSCAGSPATTAFQAALPIPPTLTQSSTDATTDYYNITMKLGTAQIIPGLSTPIWGFNGITPGPVIKAQKGRQVKVHMTNSLSENMSPQQRGGHPPSNDAPPGAAGGGPMAVVG